MSRLNRSRTASSGAYERSDFNLRLSWLNDRYPDGFPAEVSIETSAVLGTALLAFRIDLPEEVTPDAFRCVLRIGPAVTERTEHGSRTVTHFDLFSCLDDYWVNEWSWTSEEITEIDKEDPTDYLYLDDVLNGLDDADPELIFKGFTGLRGGSVEFAGWDSESRSP